MRSIYHKTSLANFTPTAPSITLAPGATQSFSYSGLRPTPDSLATTWTVGIDLGIGAQLTVSDSTLRVGSHTITATVRDTTKFVRRDPEGRLQATQSWTVVVTGAAACTVQSATALGAFSSPVTVPSNACVKVSSYPSWWDRRPLILQANGGHYPLAATWSDSCSSATGQVSYSSGGQSYAIGSRPSSCPTVIQLKGDGSPVTLNWWQ